MSNAELNRDPFREQMEAYALGALDQEDRAAIEAHLATGCAECVKALEEGRVLVSQLTPEAPPSERLRLLETVPGESPVGKPGAPAKPAIPRWLWGSVAAALLFALFNAWNRAREQAVIEATRQEIAQLVAEQQKSAKELALARREALILTDRHSIRIPMTAASKGLPVLEATWQQALGIVVSGRNLPVPAVHRTLQLWLIPKAPGSKPVASLTLRPAADGKFDLLVVDPPVSAGATRALAITEEPEGGSPAPTATPTWVGRLGGN